MAWRGDDEGSGGTDEPFEPPDQPDSSSGPDSPLPPPPPPPPPPPSAPPPSSTPPTPPRRPRVPYSVRRVPIPEEPSTRPPVLEPEIPPPPDDPLAPFITEPAPATKPGIRQRIVTSIRSAPRWQRIALLVAILLALGTVAYALFSGGDEPVASPSFPPATTAAGTTPTASAPTTTAPSAVPGLVDKNCEDFASKKEAQDFYKEAGGPEQDLHQIDTNRNGIACDETTGASPGASPTGPPATATSTAVPATSAPAP